MKQTRYVTEETFNFNDFEKIMDTYKKNKDFLGFTIHVEIDLKKGHQFHIDCQNKGYIPNITLLAEKVFQYGVTFAVDMLRPRYSMSPDHTDEEYGIIQEIFHNDIEYYMNTLYDKGLEEFIAMLDDQFFLLKSSYYFKHTRLIDGRWEMPDGSYYTPDAYMRNGNKITSLITDLIQSTISYGYTVDKTEAAASSEQVA